jgi:ferredoxin-NADP reductase/DMSO/TMAO reductase YedYZ heme-binding membrane subunit
MEQILETHLIQQFGVSFIDISSYFGLIAGGFLTANLFLGILASIQYSPINNWPYRRIPLLSIHKWTGYGTYFFSLLHPLWLVLAKSAHFSVLAVFYPVVAPVQPIINSFGALAIYSLTFVIITSCLKHLFHYPFWKKLHYVAYLAIILGLIHGVLANPAVRAGVPIDFFDSGKLFIEACAAMSVSLVVWRITLGRKLRKSAIDSNSHLNITKPSWQGQLKVIDIFDAAPTIKTFRLAMPEGKKLPFKFLPGQYLQFRIKVGERLVTRCYSISSAPHQKYFCEISIKKVDGGHGSTFLHNEVKTGDLLECVGPQGIFTFTGKESNSLVMIAGGIGITPLLSVLKHLARKKWKHDVYLLLAVRTPEDILFKKELREISRRYSHLKLLILPSKISGHQWSGPYGRINSKHLTDFIPDISHRRIHLCGPEGMMTATIATLQNLGVADSQIYTESFGAAGTIIDDGTVDATITFSKSNQSCFVKAGKTLLAAAEEAGLSIESSCQSGFCGTCKLKLLSGQVKMHRDEALSHNDLENNRVLACQARPITAHVIIDA